MEILIFIMANHIQKVLFYINPLRRVKFISSSVVRVCFNRNSSAFKPNCDVFKCIYHR